MKKFCIVVREKRKREVGERERWVVAHEEFAVGKMVFPNDGQEILSSSRFAAYAVSLAA